MTQNPQLFSGPELAPLLSEVRDRLGEDATILEANRLRQGGFAGFFAHERFEVLAVPSDAGDAPPEPATGDVAPAPRHGGLLDSLLDRADEVSSTERSRPAASGAAPRQALPLAKDGSGATDARFDEVLRTAFDGPAPTIDLDDEDTWPQPHPAGAGAAAPAQHRATPPPMSTPPPLSPAMPPMPGPAPLGTTPPSPVPAPALPPLDGGPTPRRIPPVTASFVAAAPPAAPGPEVAVLAAVGRRRSGRVPPPSHARTAPDLHGVPAAGFWSRLLRFEQLLDQTPLDAAITVLVGPVDDAVAVAWAVAEANEVDPVDLVVATRRSGAEGVAPWQVVNEDGEIARRVAYWRATARPALVVVDLDGSDGLPWSERMVGAASADLTRLVVPDLHDGHRLAATLRHLAPVAALDVSRPPAPELLLPFLEHGVRVATVCGRPLTPLLLAGLTGSQDHG